MTIYTLKDLNEHDFPYKVMEINGPYLGILSLLSQYNVFNFFCTTDGSNPSYPCVIPSEGSNYSYVKSYVLRVDQNHIDNNYIKTIKCYPSNMCCLQGVKILVNDYPTILTDGRTTSGVPYSKYTQASGIIGVTGYPMEHSRKFDKFTIERPLNLGFDNVLMNSNILQLQVEIDSTAHPRNISNMFNMEWLIET